MRCFALFLFLLISCTKNNNNSDINSKICLLKDSCNNFFVKVKIQNNSNTNICFFPPRIVFRDHNNGKVDYIFTTPIGISKYDKGNKKYIIEYRNNCLELNEPIPRKKIYYSVDSTKFSEIEKYGLEEILFIKSGEETDYKEYLGNTDETIQINGAFYIEDNLTKKFTGINFLPKKIDGYELFFDKIKSDTLRVDFF